MEHKRQIDIQPFIELIEQMTGMTLPQTNYHLAQEWILNIESEKKLSPEQYINVLKSDSEEAKKFFNAITINETYFFREEKHYRILNQLVYPELKKKSGRPVIWSSTCSTGEEALSLAMLAAEFFDEFKVIASDINSDALKTLSEGKYRSFSLRNDGKSFHHLVHQYTCEKEAQIYCIDEMIQSKIHEYHINLFSDISLIPENIDLVFFRNTLIYMKRDVQKKLFTKISSKLKTGGYLFVATSEVPIISNLGIHTENNLELLEYKGSYYFKKVISGELTRSKLVYESDKENEVSGKKFFLDRTEMPERKTASEIKKEWENQNKIQKKNEERKPEENIRKKIKESLTRSQLDKILIDTNRKVTDPEYELDRNTDESEIVMKLIKVFEKINSGNFPEAEYYISVIEGFTTESCITMYLRGVIHMQRNEDKEAVTWFRKSLNENNDLWPAHFYLANLVRKTNIYQAYREYIACKRKIERSITKGNSSYGILVENFHESYFKEMCDKWIYLIENNKINMPS